MIWRRKRGADDSKIVGLGPSWPSMTSIISNIGSYKDPDLKVRQAAQAAKEKGNQENFARICCELAQEFDIEQKVRQSGLTLAAQSNPQDIIGWLMLASLRKDALTQGWFAEVQFNGDNFEQKRGLP